MRYRGPGGHVVVKRQAGRKGTGAAALDHPMVPLTWLANELWRTGVGMKADR